MEWYSRGISVNNRVRSMNEREGGRGGCLWVTGVCFCLKGAFGIISHSRNLGVKLIVATEEG